MEKKIQEASCIAAAGVPVLITQVGSCTPFFVEKPFHPQHFHSSKQL